MRDGWTLYASGLRGLHALGNANNGANAGSCCLNANNAPSNANVNIGAALNLIPRVKPLRTEKHIVR